MLKQHLAEFFVALSMRARHAGDEQALLRGRGQKGSSAVHFFRHPLLTFLFCPFVAGARYQSHAHTPAAPAQACFLGWSATAGRVPCIAGCVPCGDARYWGSKRAPAEQTGASGARLPLAYREVAGSVHLSRVWLPAATKLRSAAPRAF